MVASPYEGQPEKNWLSITQDLIKKHPLSLRDMADATLESWKSIFDSGIGTEHFKIGKDIFPSPQIMGFFLHELIPLKLKAKYPKLWKKEKDVGEKDLVYLPNPFYSVEIKTSSNKNKIFGNRSYGQKGNSSKKDKSGYYLAVNFEKFDESTNPQIRLIRFGWLDHSDWISQSSETGQQASVSNLADKYKLVVIYKR